MTYIFFISAIISGLIFKKSKIITLYISLIMFVLSAFHYEGADINNYIIEYKNIGISDDFRYLGYSLFTKFWSNNGLDFEQYMIVFYIIVISLLIISIRLLTKRVNEVLSYYLIYSYALDVIQMKTFIAEILSLLGIVILLKLSSNKKIIKSCRVFMLAMSIIVSILAVLMHFSTLFYIFSNLFFVFWKNKSNIQKKGYKWTLIGIILIYVVCILLITNFGNIVSNIVVFVGNYASSLGILSDMGYFLNWAESRTRLGYIVPLILIFLIIYVSIFAAYNKSTVKTELKNVINSYMITACFMIPLLMLDVTFIRLIRIYMILMYIEYANRSQKKLVSVNCMLGYLAFYLSIVYGFIIDIYPVYGITLGAILKYNRFF